MHRNDCSGLPHPTLQRPHRPVAALAFATLAMVSAFAVPAAHASPSAGQPNILFVFADDQCYETIHALGHELVETPNLDRLVARGTVFNRAYNQGSWTGAVCVASRTMLNTGRFLWHAQRLYRQTEAERADGRFWSEHLKRAGYETYFSGKWHVRTKAEKAFDFATHVRPGMPRQTPQGYNRPLPGEPDPWSPSDPKFGGYWEGGKHWSEVLGDDSVNYLHQAAGREKPFFMYLAFNAPHDPRQSPAEYVARYPLEKVDVPENFLPEYPYKDAIACGKNLRDEKLAPFPRTRHAVKVHRQEYYAIITHMDAQIGRILDALEKSGKAENTYIFFSADHGLAVGHHGLMGKQNLYDHSVRVPLIVVGPDVPQGKRLDAPVYLQDVMASTLDLAGVDKPDHVQFNSLMPLVRGERDQSYDAIYGGYLDVNRSVTQDGYKLMLHPKIAKARLYHLDKDPQEMHDLAGDPQQRPRMKKLFARLLALQEEMGDTLDLSAVYPELAP